MWILFACSLDPAADPSLPGQSPGPSPYVSDAVRAEALGPAPEGIDLASFEPLPQPGPDDWLASHPEPGQSVAAFEQGERAPVDGPLILAPFSYGGEASTLATAVSAYVGIPVEIRDLGVDVAGMTGRIHPTTGEPQLYTPEVLVALRDRRPEGSFGVLGLTSIDLAPGPDWNFVFGQASYTERVGVFSDARHHGPGPPSAFRRDFHTLTHEALHMMGLHHCPYYRCAMNGSNSLEESDRTPLGLCPVCLRKLRIAIGNPGWVPQGLKM